MPTHYVWSGASGAANGDSWTDAYTSLAACVTGETLADGDTILVHKTHSNLTTSGNITITLPDTGGYKLSIICVDKDASDVPSSGAVEGIGAAFNSFTLTGASGAPTGSESLVYFQGMKFQNGTGTSSGSDMSFHVSGTTSGQWVFENCTFHLNNTVANKVFSFGITTPYGCYIVLNNCTFTFGAATQRVLCNGGRLELNNCVQSGGTAPTTMLYLTASSRGVITLNGCSFGSATYLLNQEVDSWYVIKGNNCVIPTPITGTNQGRACVTTELHACGAASGTLVIDYYYEDACGTVQDSQATAGYYLTSGGAEAKDDDGNTVKYSLAMAPSTNVNALSPLYTPWFYANVATTGDKTVAVKVATATTALKENEVWLEVEYMGEPGLAGTQRVADSPQTVREFDDLCNLVSGTLSRDVTITGDDRTDTTDAWSFDNADWTAAVAHTLTASINVAEIGYIRCRVGLAKDQDTFVDPKITVS